MEAKWSLSDKSTAFDWTTGRQTALDWLTDNLHYGITCGMLTILLTTAITLRLT